MKVLSPSYFHLKPIAQGSRSSARSLTEQLKLEDKNALVNVDILSCQHEWNIELRVHKCSCTVFVIKKELLQEYLSINACKEMNVLNHDATFHRSFLSRCTYQADTVAGPCCRTRRRNAPSRWLGTPDPCWWVRAHQSQHTPGWRCRAAWWRPGSSPPPPQPFSGGGDRRKSRGRHDNTAYNWMTANKTERHQAVTFWMQQSFTLSLLHILPLQSKNKQTKVKHRHLVCLL